MVHSKTEGNTQVQEVHDTLKWKQDEYKIGHWYVTQQKQNKITSPQNGDPLMKFHLNVTFYITNFYLQEFQILFI